MWFYWQVRCSGAAVHVVIMIPPFLLDMLLLGLPVSNDILVAGVRLHGKWVPYLIFKLASDYILKNRTLLTYPIDLPLKPSNSLTRSLVASAISDSPSAQKRKSHRTYVLWLFYPTT